MSKMRLVLLSVTLLAVASASPAIFSEERIEAMLEKLRRAKAIGEYAVNTPTGIYPIRSITKDNIRQIFNFGLGSQKYGETVDDKTGEAETKISESKDDVVGTLKKEGEILDLEAENATSTATAGEEQKPTNESTLVEEVKAEEGGEKKAEEGAEKKAEEGTETKTEEGGMKVITEEGKEKVAEGEGELAKEKVEEKKAEETNAIEEEGKPAEGRLGGGPSIEGFSEPKSAEGQPEGKTSEIQKEKSSEEQSLAKPIEAQAPEGTVQVEQSTGSTTVEGLTQATESETKQPSEITVQTATGSTSEALAEGLSTSTAFETNARTESPDTEAAAKEGGSGTEEEIKVVDAQVAENATTEQVLDEGKAAGTATEVVAETTAEAEKKEAAESSSSSETMGTAATEQPTATFAQSVVGAEAPREVEHKEVAEGSAEAPEGAAAEGSAAEETASVPSSETSTLLTGTGAESPSNEITTAAESTTSPQAA